MLLAAELGSDRLHGRWLAEALDADVRVITAPQPGIFLPIPVPPTGTVEEWLTVGGLVGVVVRSGVRHPVRSPFAGRWMGLLVLPGERVRLHQPLAWLALPD